MMRRCLVLLVVFLTGTSSMSRATGAASEDGVLRVGSFSTAAPGSEWPDNWKPLMFKQKRPTRYRLVRDGDRVVVRASSEAAASGLARELTVDPQEYPIVEWQWKVMNLLERSDVRRKDGDDYPGRLYITFEYDPSRVGLFEKAKYEAARLLYGQYPPLGALNYIWATKEPADTLAPNAYTDRAVMVVVESGPARLGRWVTERRNVRDDYRRAFPATAEPLPRISGVAIMTDTDDTGEAATTYFGDIVFRRAGDP